MGLWRGRPVTYQVINGRNIYQGDIILENVQPMPTVGGAHPASVGLADAGFLWDKVNGVAQIPYEIDTNSSDVANIQSAISIYNSTFAGVIQFVPHTTQANWVDLNLNGFANGSCEAEEGDAHNGEQMVNGATNCTVPTILHEFGHVTGVWHEQSRDDASQYVTVNESNVIKGSIGDFEPSDENDQQNLTLYDFASVMEYPPFSFARNAGPALDSVPPGMPLSNLVGYSVADVEGIMRLYGVAPTEVTVTSNPLGLQVSVDGSLITTPMTFSWSLNSTHTLSVATGVQTVNGVIVDSNPNDAQEPTTFYYTYGRWNDNGAQSHSITVTPGNGDVGFPASAPAVATYTANFIQLVPFTFTVSTFSSGTGTVSLTGTPSPQNLMVNGVNGTYVVARQLATLTATPASGSNFYAFLNGPFFLSGGTGANPKQFYVPDTGLTIDPFTEFTKSPIYTVDVSPDIFDSNLGVFVDGAPWDTPKNFSPDANLDGSAWNPATTHNLAISATQQLFSVNTKYDFVSWNTGATPTNANGNSVTLPATSSSFIATLTPSFVPATNFAFGGPCGGNGAITPASTDSGFYPSGTQLTFTATPSTTTPAGQWIFTGWTGDVTTTTNPLMLTPTDESLVNANFNTAAASLTITSLSPSSVVAGSGPLVLTINGTGFTPQGGNPNEIVGFNFTQGGPTFPVTFVSSTELQVTVPATAIATPGTFLLYIENFPSSDGCAVFAHQAFFVSQGPGSGATTVTATPTSLTFSSTVVDQTSASQPITVKNTGTPATTIAVTASTNFGQTNSCPVAPSTLAGGATCTINAMFAPTTAGNLTGNIAVTDSASNSPQIVTLSGTATPAVTTVTATPSSIAFGSQAFGTTTTSPTTITVANTGAASTSISIAASTNYSQINNCGTLLQIGTSCTITVSFTPTANGSLPGTISITDSATNSPQTVTLSGTGTGAPTVTVTATPTTLTFASQLLGTSSTSQTVTVKNTSTLSTTLSVGAATGDYAESGNTCGGSLGAGVSCTFNVTFTPTATGTRTGSISITDQATNSPQSVSLTGTGFSVIVAPTPTSLTFTSQTVGTTSASQPVTVKNTGTGTTTLSIGAATGDFSQTNACPSSLTAGASCTVNVTFTPTATGTRTGSFAITDQASNSPQSVTLTGTGAAAAITVTATPTSLTFAATAVGSTSASQPITVKNTGTGNTTVSISASTNFGQTNNCPVSPATLNAGLSCTVNATFVPTATGSLSGTISVTDSASNSPQTVSLSGTGLTTMTVTPSTLTFGNQNVGTTSASQPITVKNTGTASTSITVAPSTNYSQTNTCGASLGGGVTCTINVSFAPTTSGSLPGTITITDSAATSPQTVTLSGTGTTVIVTPSPTSLTFPSQTVGTTSGSMSFTVTNTGTGSTPLTIGAATGDFAQTNNCTGSLAATNGSCTVNVTFTPTVTGTRTGSISITDQAANSPQTVSLSGTGGTGSVTITISPASETFAAQALNTTSAIKAVTVKNTGTASTTISVGAAIGDFAETNTCNAGGPGTGMLAAGKTCTINVTFTPATTGTLTGSIAITDQASNSPQSVSLTGTGVVQATVSPTTLAFGNEAVGGTSTAKIVTLTNNLSTTLSGISFSAGTNYSAVPGTTTPCGATLASKAHCTISVTFSPTTTGSLPGTLTVTDSANNSPQTVTLSGTGTAPVVITVTPASETFAAQAVGTTSAGKVINVKNTGGQSTSIATALSGDFSAPSNTCNGTLGAGATCSITAVFTPSTTGSISGVITITDAGLNSPQIVTLTGTAVAPVTFSPVSLAFGSQAVNMPSSPAKTVTIKNNNSTGSLTLTLVTSANYSTTGCTSPLSAGATCTMSVTFDPTADGSIDGAVTVTYTGTYSPVEVKLTGTGTGGGTSPLKFTPATLAFTSQATGTTSAGKTLTVQNISGSTVTLSSIATSGNFTAVGGTTNPCSNTSTLIAGASCTLSVTFSPSIAGAIQGALVISDNATPVNQQVVNLTGTAVLPLTIAPASLTFASQTVGVQSAAQTLTLTNNSSSAFNLTSFAGTSDFSVVSGGTMPCGGSLSAGAKCTLSVTFTPGRTGSIPGEATITDNASTNPQVVKLTGTGS